MAKDTCNNELDELAFRLYAERIAKMPVQINGEESSSWAYRKAKDFLAVRDAVKSGEFDKHEDEGPQLDDGSCPNLKPSHPYNLVSKRFGSFEAVAKAIDLLERHSKDDAAAFRAMDWDEPTVRLARHILPGYSKKALTGAN